MMPTTSVSARELLEEAAADLTAHANTINTGKAITDLDVEMVRAARIIIEALDRARTRGALQAPAPPTPAQVLAAAAGAGRAR